MFSFKFAFGIALLLCSLSTPAANNDEVRKTTEYTTLVSGSIDIDRSGRVVAHTFSDEAKLGKPIVEALQGKIRSWRFAPPEVPTHADRVRASMDLRIVLARHGEDAMAMRVVGANFGEVPEHARIQLKRRPITHYPIEADARGVTGNVYLVFKIGRDGRPLDVVAERVDLTVVDEASRMDHWRSVLGSAAVQQARRWRFTIPTAGPEADAPYWTASIPVRFVSPRAAPATDWEAYIPGPVRDIPWKRADGSTVGVGALAFGEVHTAGSTLRLTTPLDDA